MDIKLQKKNAKEFAKFWEGKGYEKGQSQPFWMSLLHDVLGVENPEKFISFEDQVKLDHTSFIDGYIESTHVMIEQKSIDKDLNKAIKQSDGSLLNPFQQAKRYSADLPYSQRPRWIITCNFKEFYIYDMEKPNGEPEIILLKDLPKEFYRLSFIVDSGNEHLKKELEVSVKAGEIVGLLYDAFLKEYNDIENEHSIQSLNKLCVRIVFCLYAEDAGLFRTKNQFYDYLNAFETKDVRRALIDLFKVLNTPLDQRDPYLEDILLEFPYVNGGLFEDENIEIPRITDDIRTLLLTKASDEFNWSEISPTIFGAVFESTLNPETRRKGGMHYTSIENIHKVIDPLFLDELKQELEEIKRLVQQNAINRRVEEFQNKLSSLTFLDPAAGSGNFLTETYISLRRLENEAIAFQRKGGMDLLGNLEGFNPIKVKISQCNGIEINDFAVTVAQTALWIAENQMMEETRSIIDFEGDFLPLKTKANIVEGNALRMDWNDVVDSSRLNYIIGNPPFIGQSMRTKEQSNDMALVWGKGEIETKLDYVICWYKKAMDYIKDLKNIVEVAFVSTNSICQGESVPTFWKKMIDQGAEIEFAYQTFEWDSETKGKAVVHCVIIGFANMKMSKEKKIYSGGVVSLGDHINPYLLFAPDVWITNRINKPRNGLSKMTTGSPPTDDGGLTLTKEEKNELLNKYPTLIQYVKPFIGAKEFLHDKIGDYSRYCLWFENSNPTDFSNIPEIKSRLIKVKNKRLSSNADRINKMADYPYLFCQIRQPKSTYLVIPRHSSQNRRYIPIGFKESDVIVGDACSIIPEVSKFEFGVLMSNIHNYWVRLICGRIKSDFRYSPSVYNNFPWPKVTESQRNRIIQTASGIMEAREKYSNSCLSDLYNDLTMPVELREAHRENDKAVMEAYGFDWRNMTESECVAELMKMYQEMTEKK